MGQEHNQDGKAFPSEEEQPMTIGYTFGRSDLETFRRSWPCHGLPDSLDRIWFGFGSNGDLVEIEAKARNGRRLDSAKFDGPAWLALSRDAQAKCQF